ncbi:tetratricopeptide repeat protein [Aerococcus sanguinicola]|uniref:tetratricopeptide repeat protein n=1 Tax=unclassified Aerococcus TaxID=2618060 RepID=UPI0008A639C3|nr:MULTISPECIES: tetratricopeptide repeat protein [unclassified Aerococcus]KAB0645756.1 tetratricopeptide repeat protein [Aerococcus sanguinicola]MDK6234332.1 tetratricopeptide repeat protein [Aerococcus sp. UMB10185]MDK6856437.1 tetratricopeptide repeat protein [Aerococcus sp. UMB7533]OFN01199.1 hypothetical protein HMPREF2626_08025 [Aerococcus sp. HMSC062A02]OHO44341.1 hypothetical protein HMPREF2705_07010 [Aerococcus sp. HMSC035B07]
MINDRIQSKLHEAHSLWREGKEEAMLSPLEEALQLARQVGNTSKTIEILSEYGGALRVTGNLQEAEKALTEVVKLLEQIHAEKHPPYGTALVNLANLYRVQKRHKLALYIFKRAKYVFEDIHCFDYNYTSLCNNLALLYQSLGEDTEAIQLLKETITYLQADEKYLLPLVTSYNNLTSLYLNQGDLSLAQSYLDQAKDLARDKLKHNAPIQAAILNNQGLIHQKNKNYEASKTSFQTSLKFLAQSYGENSPDYQSVKSNLEIVRGALHD